MYRGHALVHCPKRTGSTECDLSPHPLNPNPGEREKKPTGEEGGKLTSLVICTSSSSAAVAAPNWKPVPSVPPPPPGAAPNGCDTIQRGFQKGFREDPYNSIGVS
jgi:hypothetical protein